MIVQRRVFVGSFGNSQGAGFGWGLRLVLAGLILVGFAFFVNRKNEADSSPMRVTKRPDFSAWAGSWQYGDSVLLIRGDGTGAYSADGSAKVPFHVVVRGNEATFRVNIGGRPWRLSFSDSGRLVGLLEMVNRGPLVVSPGRTSREKEEEKAQHKADIKATLVPTDFGTFSRN
jgi:hypothetical protein